MVSVAVDICFSCCRKPGPGACNQRGREAPERLSYRKRRAAPAAGLGVGVVEDESLAHQARVVVERRAIDESIALGIDEEPRSFWPVEHTVPFARTRLPGERIAEP